MRGKDAWLGWRVTWIDPATGLLQCIAAQATRVRCTGLPGVEYHWRVIWSCCRAWIREGIGG